LRGRGHSQHLRQDLAQLRNRSRKNRRTRGGERPMTMRKTGWPRPPWRAWNDACGLIPASRQSAGELEDLGQPTLAPAAPAGPGTLQIAGVEARLPSRQAPQTAEHRQLGQKVCRNQSLVGTDPVTQEAPMNVRTAASTLPSAHGHWAQDKTSAIHLGQLRQDDVCRDRATTR
jgi:hypothetical protein